MRWKETVEHLDYMVNNVSGDVLLSAGYVAYLGPFTVSLRALATGPTWDLKPGLYSCVKCCT